MVANARNGGLALLGGTPARVPVAKRYPAFSEAAKRRVERLLDDGSVSGLSKAHPEIGAAEAALGDYHSVPWVLGTSSGHGALHAALIGLEITGGDEVMTSPFSWGVSVSCILHNGCIPTFADVQEGTGLLDPASVSERLTDRTRAILVPHIFGNPADMTALCAIAAERGIPVIEDGSQAHGARHRGRRVGSFGDASGFSCNGVKPLATSEAGYLLAKDGDTYWKAALSCAHAGGAEHPGRASEPGFPDALRPHIDSLVYTYRLSTINAALIIEQLKQLDDENAVRREHLALLRAGIDGVASVRIPELHEDDESAVHMVSLTFDPDVAGVSKATYMAALRAEGLFAFEYLTQPLHRSPRLSPHWSGPRVVWTDTLRRANYDPTTVELPGAERQVQASFQLTWNYVEFDPGLVEGIVDTIVKVEENLDALRGFERRRSEA
jgi:perosamine synthetase